jgi:hypothetical protein
VPSLSFKEDQRTAGWPVAFAGRWEKKFAALEVVIQVNNACPFPPWRPVGAPIWVSVVLVWRHGLPIPAHDLYRIGIHLLPDRGADDFDRTLSPALKDASGFVLCGGEAINPKDSEIEESIANLMAKFFPTSFVCFNDSVAVLDRRKLWKFGEGRTRLAAVC